MRKRILSVVVALCLIVGMCPIFASAGGRFYDYVFDSDGVRTNVGKVYAGEGTRVDSKGNGWVWDKATKTLTLSGANFESASDAMTILFCGDATIHLADGTKNTVSTFKSSNAGAGIYCDGNLTITGKGTLDLKWTGQTYAYNEYPELTAYKKLLIADGSITAESLRGKEQIQVAGGNVTVNSIGYCPLSVDKVMETDYHNKKVNLSVSGGSLTTSELRNDLNITGGTVSVTKTFLMSDNALSVKNGTLNILAKDSSSLSVRRIDIDNANVNANGSITAMISEYSTVKETPPLITIKNVSGAKVFVSPDPNYYVEMLYNSSANAWDNKPLKIVAKTPFIPVDPPKPPKPTVGGFSDVYEDDYYADAVVWAVKNGVTNGIGDGKFGPGNSCTRGQIVTFLWNAAGKPEPRGVSNSFADVKPSDYFYKAVLWAIENDITSGTGENTFSPNNSCTRNQAVTFLWRAEGKPSAAGGNVFTDVESGSYYEEAVNWAVANKITSGTSANKFSPGQVCTRGQIVTLLYRTK